MKSESKSKISGYLLVGINDYGEVVLNLDKDRNGIGHIIFSPEQARDLAKLLVQKSREAEGEK